MANITYNLSTSASVTDVVPHSSVASDPVVVGSGGSLGYVFLDGTTTSELVGDIWQVAGTNLIHSEAIERIAAPTENNTFFEARQTGDPEVIQLPNGNFIFLWDRDSGITDAINGSVYTDAGDFIMGNRTLEGLGVSSPANISAAALSNDTFVLTYTFGTLGDWAFEIYSPDLTVASGTFNPVVTSPAFYTETDTHVASVPGMFAVVTYGYSSTPVFNYRVHWFAEDGSQISGPFIFNQPHGGQPVIATVEALNTDIAMMSNGNVVIATQVDRLADGKNDITLSIMQSDGTILYSNPNASPIVNNTTAGVSEPSVTVLDNDYIVLAYQQDYATESDIVFQVHDETGALVVLEGQGVNGTIKISSSSLDDNSVSITALEGGAFAISYQAEDNGIQTKVYDITREVELLSGADTAPQSNLDEKWIGDENNNTLTGAGGQDTLNGNGGDDTLLGGAGIDELNGGDGNDSIDGGQGDDSILGGIGNDTINGGDGDDGIESSPGADVHDGGLGTDTIFYDNIQASFRLDLTNETASTGTAAGDTFTGIEVFFGTAFTDEMIGADEDVTLIGNAGHDTLTGGTGRVTLDGGVGEDVLTGGSSDDSLLGGDDDDILSGGSGADTLDGGNGFDTVTYAQSTSGVVMDLDLSFLSEGDAQGDTFFSIESYIGTQFDDRFRASSDNVNFAGLGGADTLVSGTGADTLDGGEGFDIVSFEDSNAVTLDLTDLSTATGNAVGDAYASIEAFVGSYNNDHFSGTAQGDQFDGTWGDDTLDGRGGDDTLIGGTGSDIMNGGEGDDLFLSLFDEFETDTIDGGTGVDTVSFENSTQEVVVNNSNTTTGPTFQNIERFVGSVYNDSITGGLTAATLEGRAGDDTLSGGLSEDTLIGGAGNDEYLVIFGGANTDLPTLLETAGGGMDSINIGYFLSSYVIPDHIENLAFLGGVFDEGLSTLLGNDENNVMTVIYNGSMVLSGLGGDDTIFADSSDDTLIGGSGADFLVGSGGQDLASYENAESGVTLDLLDSSNNTGDAFGDMFQDIERFEGSDHSDMMLGSDGNDAFHGGAGADTLAGGLGNDTLIGGEGDDELEGGAGRDVLIGGSGIDLVSFVSLTNGLNINVSDNSQNTGEAAGDFWALIEGVRGTQGNDTISGNADANRLLGEAGQDSFIWTAGDDTIDGGSDTDALTFVDALSGIRYLGDQNRAEIGTDVQTVLNVENVTGSIFGDYMVGTDANDRLRGLGDYDWFVGSEGNDFYDGGNGRDMISYLSATEGVTVNLADNGANTGQATGDRYVSIERVTGSVHVDVFYGDEGSNDFRGLGGYDVFYASTGGRERYDGGNGSDTVTYVNSTAGIIASLARGFGSGGDAALDLYKSIENLGGTAFADVLTGTNDRNNLRGLGGDDLIFGGGGIDRIAGGRGNDTIDGGDGSDYILYNGSSTDFDITREGTTRNATVSWTGPGAGDGTDTLTNIEYLVFDDTTINIWSL